ncbi:MAG: hypothetical protein AAF690_00345 [Acidobacteriota bacterium]
MDDFRGGVALTDTAVSDQELHAVRWVDASGAHRFVAREGDTAPNGGAFVRFCTLKASDDWVVFEAETAAGSGLFAWDPVGGLRSLVDQTTPIPGLGTGYLPPDLTPRSDSPFAVVGRKLAFVQNRIRATSDPLEVRCQGGVFLWEEGSLSEVASNRDRSPELDEKLHCFFAVFLGAHDLWFRATTYTVDGGPTVRMPSYGEMLRRRGTRLERLLGFRDEALGESLWEFTPLLLEDRAVFYLGVNSGGRSTIRFGLYAAESFGATPVPTGSDLGVALLVLVLMALGIRRIRGSI